MPGSGLFLVLAYVCSCCLSRVCIWCVRACLVVAAAVACVCACVGWVVVAHTGKQDASARDALLAIDPDDDRSIVLRAHDVGEKDRAQVIT